MTRRDTAQGSQAQAGGKMDKAIRGLAGVTVAGLAGIAGAISYSHMRVLAEANGQAGWHAHAFPLSVDGVEIVASLVLLADRRTGHRSGWLPWTALAIGTAASLAANVATAGPTPISRIIAGWPAFALLLAVKLLAGMLEHRDGDRPAPAVPVPGRPAPAPEPGRATARPAVPAPAVPAADSRTGTGTAADHGLRLSTGTGTGPGTDPEIAALLPAARVARDDLTRDGHPVIRDAIAARLRRDGHPVRNARLTPLMYALRHDTAA